MNAHAMRHLSRLQIRTSDGVVRVYDQGGSVTQVAHPSWRATVTSIYQKHNRSYWIEAVDEDGQRYALPAHDWQPVTTENDMPVKKKTELDPEQIAIWDDDIIDILAAMKAGYLDSHLRDIAATAIERHREVSGKTILKTVDDQEVKPYKAASPKQLVGEQLAIASVPLANKTWADAHKTEARHVTDNQGSIRHFEKARFIGKVIKILPGTLEDTQYDGLRVKVSGMGGKMVKIDFVDPPPAGSNYAKKEAAKQPCFVTYKIILPYLDIN